METFQIVRNGQNSYNPHILDRKNFCPIYILYNLRYNSGEFEKYVNLGYCEEKGTLFSFSTSVEK